ncbi:MAG: DUF2281 domain-containing protein [Balneolales bacterium]
MSEPTVSKKIKQLPPEAKKQAQDYVDFLYQRYVQGSALKKPRSAKISNSPFYGIWKDREEMSDSVEWVRNVRKSHWSNP